MNKKYLLLLALALSLPSLVMAVTDKEMEEARTITAITYLRYANDGSGYLDSQHPKTMAELNKILKDKEKENLKTFTAVANPKDYASWDKQKLIEYWTGTFFNSPGLIAKGKVGKNRTRSRLQAMTVATPAAPKSPATATAAPKTEPSSQAEAKSPADATGTNDKPAKETPRDTAETVATPAPYGNAGSEADLFGQKSDSLETAAEILEQEDKTDRPRRNSHTGVYIAILAALVIVVIALVVYASNSMKRDKRRKEEQQAEEGSATVDDAVAQRMGNNAMREKYSAAINQKNNEIADLNLQLDSLRSQNQSLQHDLNESRQRIRQLEGQLSAISQDTGSLRPDTDFKPQPPSPEAPAPARLPARRTIYLGRVNNRGLFVRADKTVNADLSVFRLETEDGFSGTFRVLQSPEIDRRLMSNPAEWLTGGCVAHDANAPQGHSTIHTEVGGTAIFEGGVWRVIRKARISYK